MKTRIATKPNQDSSLKTAAQQESAHAIHGIGTDIDEATSKTMAAIGAAADRSIVEIDNEPNSNARKIFLIILSPYQ